MYDAVEVKTQTVDVTWRKNSDAVVIGIADQDLLTTLLYVTDFKCNYIKSDAEIHGNSDCCACNSH